MSVSEITIRPARLDDSTAIAELAALDSAHSLQGDVVVGEIDGRIVAAMETVGGRAVADPFRPTADVVELLRVRAGGEAEPRRRRPRRRAFRALPRLA